MNHTLQYLKGSDIIDTFVEVELNGDTFLSIAETLTRIGVTSYTEERPVLYQSCHILHKRKKYYICHFKEMFMLDGRSTNLSEEDIRRRNSIVDCLRVWKMCTPVDMSKIEMRNSHSFSIIKYSEKSQWDLRTKYNIGKESCKKT